MEEFVEIGGCRGGRGAGWIFDCGNGPAAAEVICRILRKSLGGAWDFEFDGGRAAQDFLGRAS